MWWGLREHVRIYVARGLVMAETAGGKHLTAREFAADAPPHEALELLLPFLRPRSVVSVHLSAALSPAVLLELPAGLARHEERLEYARVMCGQALQEPNASELEVRVDPFHPRIATGVSRQLLQQLHEWARRHSLLVGEVRPLWGRIPRMRSQPQPRDIVLTEPDSVTAMHVELSAGGGVSGATLPLDASLPTNAQARRLGEALHQAVSGADGSEVLHLEFHATALQRPYAVAGSTWQAHWVRQ